MMWSIISSGSISRRSYKLCGITRLLGKIYKNAFQKVLIYEYKSYQIIIASRANHK